MSGILNMDNSKITSLETPTDDKDAATKKYVDDQDNLQVSKSGDTKKILKWERTKLRVQKL